MNARRAIGFTVIAILAALSFLAWGLVTLPFWDYTGHWRVMAKYWAQDAPIAFYGRVVEGEGQPVPDAVVTLDVIFFDSRGAWSEQERNYFAHRRHTLVTDRLGRFEIQNERGTLLSIVAIQAAGFIEFPEKNWRYDRLKELSFHYATGENRVPYAPLSTKPATFVLRRAETSEPASIEKRKRRLPPSGS